MTLKNKSFKIDIDVNKFRDVYCSCSSFMYKTEFWKKKLPGSEFCEDCIKTNREEKINIIIDEV
mgnify:CR=1 FL=1